MTKTVQLATGRIYDFDQVLAITFDPDQFAPDYEEAGYVWVPVRVVDASRGIKFDAQVFACELGTDRTLLKAVLGAYDAGRYAEF